MNACTRPTVSSAAKLKAIQEESRIADLLHDSGQSSGYAREKCIAEAAAILVGAKADPEALEAAHRKVSKVWDGRFHIPGLRA